MHQGKIISQLRSLEQEAVNVGVSLREDNWGGLVNIDQTFEEIATLNRRISDGASILGEVRVQRILGDGPPPKIILHEAPSNYLERGKRWAADTKQRLGIELNEIRNDQTLCWTKVSAVAAIIAIVIAALMWLASRHF